MGFARSVRELEVWVNAMDVAMDIFERSKRFPANERYSLTDQVLRSSRSVAANVAEAWRKRRYPAVFVNKLSDAETEAGETQTWVEVARRCGYLKDEEAAQLEDRCEKVLAQLVKMMARPGDWCGGLEGRR